MHTAATLVLLLSACDAPKGGPSETGGGPADTGPGRGDSETGSPSSGCDSADRAGGDTADPDTGDAPDRCDQDLHGARNIKICGTGDAQELGTDVSMGVMKSGTMLIGLGSKGSLDDGGNAQVSLFAAPHTSGWSADGVPVSEPVSEDTNFFGRALELGADLDGDDEADLAVSSASASEPSPTAPGRVYIYYGPLDAPRAVSDADAIVTSDTDDGGVWYGGLNMAEVPDIDGDGDDELLTGGYWNNTAVGTHCVPTLLLGPVASMSRYDAAATYLSGRDREGPSVASPGTDSLAVDLTGDGIAEIVLSEGKSDDLNGAVYIVPGDLRGTVTVEDGDVIYPSDRDAVSGLFLSAGDADGDGSTDLSAAISIYGHSWLFNGPINTSLLTSEAYATLGEDPPDRASAVQLAGDLTGDGVSGDISWVGRLTSQAYVYPAPISPGAHTLAEATLVAWSDGDDYLGWSLEPIPDLDGDGADELLLGAPYDDEGGTYAGAAYLLYGASW